MIASLVNSTCSLTGTAFKLVLISILFDCEKIAKNLTNTHRTEVNMQHKQIVASPESNIEKSTSALAKLHLSQLPDELFLNILKYLTYKEVIALNETCKKFMNIIAEHETEIPYSISYPKKSQKDIIESTHRFLLQGPLAESKKVAEKIDQKVGEITPVTKKIDNIDHSIFRKKPPFNNDTIIKMLLICALITVFVAGGMGSWMFAKSTDSTGKVFGAALTGAGGLSLLISMFALACHLFAKKGESELKKRAALETSLSDMENAVKSMAPSMP
jgi:hypothetical protein